jgi:hypothetical protein
MNRFDITLGKKPPSLPKETKKEQSQRNFKFLHGLITIMDDEGNKIEGFIQNMQYDLNAPVSMVRSFLGESAMVRGRQETRLTLDILVDRTIMKDVS